MGKNGKRDSKSRPTTEERQQRREARQALRRQKRSQATAMYRDGATRAQIAQALGVSVATAGNLIYPFIRRDIRNKKARRRAALAALRHARWRRRPCQGPDHLTLQAVAASIEADRLRDTATRLRVVLDNDGITYCPAVDMTDYRPVAARIAGRPSRNGYAASPPMSERQVSRLDAQDAKLRPLRDRARRKYGTLAAALSAAPK